MANCICVIAARTIRKQAAISTLLAFSPQSERADLNESFSWEGSSIWYNQNTTLFFPKLSGK
jgi:hypothetical protein